MLEACTLSSPRCIVPPSPCGYDFTRVLSMNRETNRDDMEIIFLLPHDDEGAASKISLKHFPSQIDSECNASQTYEC